MGMSASQARFLSLTARKNNVEFEGQQINQQRTTLSNESASYYSELCNMEVPTPPSIDDYTKVSYTFNDGAMTNTLISLLPDTTSDGRANNRYVVNYVEQWQDDYAIVPAASSLVERGVDADGNADGTFSIGAQYLRNLGEASGSVSSSSINIGGVTYTVLNDAGGYYINETNEVHTTVDCTPDEIGRFEYYAYLSAETILQMYKGSDGNFYSDEALSRLTTYTEDDLIICLFDDTQTDPDRAVLFVNKDGATGNYVKEAYVNETTKRYLTDTELASVSTYEDYYLSTLNPDGVANCLLNEEYYINMLNSAVAEDTWYVRYVKNTTTGVYEPYFYAYSELNQSQKYNNKNLGSIPCYSLGSKTQTREVLHKEATVEKDSSGRYVAITIKVGEDSSGNAITRTYNLTTTTTTDEEAYNDAMNQYNYKQHEYDHKIQEINSKLEIIQQQDKQLELKLKQLDTEENAIQTEMDAVKKVISKNVESSFKTFSA